MSISAVSRNRVFPETRWTLVAATGDPSNGADAIGALYTIYWPAVYAYVRQRGRTREDSEDLVQSFFSHLIESRAFGRADRLRGRFRSFLLVSLKNFMASQYQRGTALKRGGDPLVVIDSTLAEAWYTSCAVSFDAPDRVYDRRWAMALLNRARRRLRREFVKDDKEALFESLIPYLVHSERWERADASAACSQTDGARRIALHRLRRRFANLLRDEIRQTVTSSEQVTEELRYLLAAIGRPRSQFISGQP